MISEGLTFKTHRRHMRQDTIADASAPTAAGFTAADLAALGEVRAAALARRRWTRAEIIHDPFIDYLAAWHADSDAATPPTLAIARFKRTGTYALTVGSVVVATARTLGNILPAIHGLLQSSDSSLAAAL